MSAIKKLDTAYIKNNFTTSNTLNVLKSVKCKTIITNDKISIGNICIINKNLKINKNLNWAKVEKNSLLDIDNQNSTIIIKNNLNQYHYSSLYNIFVNNNTIFNTTKKLTYNTNLLIENSFISSNLSSESLINNKNVIAKTINVKNAAFINNLNTNNIIIKKNTNTNSDIVINVNNSINTGGVQYMGSSNLVINYDAFINKVNIQDDSNLVLKNVNFNKNLSGGLKFNSNKNTLEGYYNNKWKPISHLYSSDYKTFIDLKDYDYYFYQNNNITISINNITNNFTTSLCVNNNSNITSKSITVDNINIKNSLLLENDFKNTGILRLPYSQDNTGIEGSLRYNSLLKKIEYYNDRWNPLGLSSSLTIDNNNTLTIKSNSILCSINNFNTIFYPNLNIEKSCHSNNINVKYDTILDKNLLIKDEPIIFNSNSNKLFYNSVSNYGKNDFSLLEINKPTIESNFYNEYISEYFYVNASYNNYSYCLKHYNHNNNFIPNNIKKFIYHYFSTETIIINSIEFSYFIINEFKQIYVTNLADIKNNFSIIIYNNDNNLVYNSESTNTTFILDKDKYYTIQLKILNLETSINNENNIFIRLSGFYELNHLLFKNNNIDFLYNIDSHFYNNINFTNNLNLLKTTNIFSNLNVSKLNIDKLFINLKKDNSNDSIICIKDSNFKKCFEILNNNIIIGNINNLNILNNQNIILKTDNNDDTLFVNGNTIIKNNISINNNVNVKNNVIISNDLNYNIINTKFITLNNNLNINTNLNSEKFEVQNLYTNYNNNKLNNILINNVVYNNKLINKTSLINSLVNINDNNINYDNKLLINKLGQIALNSDEIIDTFSVGNKLKPNLSISNNGLVKINCLTESFFLNNINIIKELNILKSNII